MLSLEDCIALSTLTEPELAAIAEHEHLPMIVATELGNYLVQTADGCCCIQSMIRDDIAGAEQRGDAAHALALKLVLKTFIRDHPEAKGMIGDSRHANILGTFFNKVPHDPVRTCRESGLEKTDGTERSAV